MSTGPIKAGVELAQRAPAVTLQVNLAPTDLKHLREILPHELRQFGGQVSEILLVLDLNRHSLVDEAVWLEGATGIRDMVAELNDRYPHLRLIDVDASSTVSGQVAAEFFGGQAIPQRDWRGAPIYPYFFGLWAACHRYVLHMDSDMLFGGGSQSWVAEAVSLLASKPDTLVCSPLPGPPTRDGLLTSQTLPLEPYDSLAYRAREVSTRIFMLDRHRFRDRVRALKVLRPSAKNLALAWVDGYPPYETAERILTSALTENGMFRVDFLGSGDGMWSLHPPFRSPSFYRALPSLISRIERDDVPDGQRGDYDLNDTMFDWSDARPGRLDRLVWHLSRIKGRISR